MGTISFNQQTLGFITYFEKFTRTKVLDCIDTPERIVFVVEQGSLRRALGPSGEVIRRLRERFKRIVDVIEFSDDPSRFLTNIFHNVRVREVRFEERDGKNHATVMVDPADKGKAIGRAGQNLKLAKDIMSRHHPVESVRVG